MLHSRTTSPLALALLAATMLTPPAPARAAPGDAVGPEFQVNSYTPMQQREPAVAMNTDGDFVVAWGSAGQDGSDRGIYAQRFDAAGVPQGSEFLVNTFITGTQRNAAVAMDADGDFVVAWGSFEQDGPSSWGIYAQRYDAAGVAQGPELQVNSYTTFQQQYPAVAMDADGAFVVAWSGAGPDDRDGIFARRYDATGAAQGLEFRVNVLTTDYQYAPTVAMDADGDFVVAWVSDEPYVYNSDIFAQRYDAAGVARGTEIQVNTYTTDGQSRPAVAMDADGDFVVAWTSYGQDGSFDGIFAQRFGASGAAQGPEIEVNTYTTGGQSGPAVAMDADGDFVVAWSGSGASEVDGIYAQRYDAAGAAQGAEFHVNTFLTNGQTHPAVAMDADGEVVVAWTDFGGQDGDDAGIFAQRYQGDGPVAGDFTVDGRSDLLWRHTAGNTSLWEMDGFAREGAGSIGAPDPVWQIRGLADFNADTKADVLWRHTTTGSAAIWLMDAYKRLDAGVIGGASLDWRIVGAGDFDGDDHADILWRNVTSGAAVIWLMDGLSRAGAGGIGGAPLAWQVVGVGDFDADAKSDILWRHTTNNAAVVWLMDGFTKLRTGTAGAPPPAWQVAGLGTFTGDARSDILWHNSITGNTVIWEMSGLAREDAASIGVLPLVWRIDGVGDTDGDRQSDIVWRNTGTGNTLIWRMDGFSKEAVSGIGSVPLVWEVQ